MQEDICCWFRDRDVDQAVVARVWLREHRRKVSGIQIKIINYR